MRRVSYVGAGVVSLVLAAAAPLAAQQGQWMGKLAAGYSPPLGSYNDFVNDGWNGQIGFGYFPHGGKFGVTFEWNRSWNNVDDAFLFAAGIPDGQSRIWSLTLNGVVSPLRQKSGAKVRPYLIGGAGYYHRTVDFYGGTVLVPIFDPWWGFVGTVPAQTVLGSFGEDAFGVNGGLGFLVPFAGGGAVFLEGRYHYAWTDNTGSQVLPIVLGFAYTY
jgi:hypothetical protein